MGHTIAVLIPAHNEADALGRTLPQLRAGEAPPESIILIADHCTDDTARVAEQYGAAVVQRLEGERGKGAALRWLFEGHPNLLGAYPITVILDADTLVDTRFFAEVRRAFAEGAEVVQGFLQPIGYEESIASTLAAYSEVLAQKVDDALRARLGWPVPLRGTGMAFRTELLRDLLPQVRTLTEDIELSLLLAERRVRVQFLPGAIVYDPKPGNADLLSRQRARWLKGQFQVWRHHSKSIARLLWRGPRMWWLLSALLLKPKTFFASLKVVTFALALTLPIPLWTKAVLLALILSELAYYLVGLWLAPQDDRRRYARALLSAPAYLGMW